MILESKLAEVLTTLQFRYGFVFHYLYFIVSKGIQNPVNQFMSLQLTARNQLLELQSNLDFVEKSVTILQQVHLSNFAYDHLSYRHAFVNLSPINVMEVVNDE